MATCPKCEKKLKIYHWRPECPFCGVNMVYYNSNDRLLAETEQAEIEHALSQPGIDRAKASFFGSAPAIIRLILSVLPIGALFLPLVKVLSSGKTVPINAIGIYNFVSKTGISLGSQSIYGLLINASVVLIVFSAVMILVCLGCLVMSLGKHGKLRNLILNILLTGSAVLAAVCFIAGQGHLNEIVPGCEGGKLAAGIFVYIALTLVIMIYNLDLAKKGLKIKHTVCYIGGLKSEDYFAMKEQGVSELEIKKKMVEALTAIQEEVRAKAAEEEAKKQAELAARK
ncbi:MAG: hypothetical protein IJU45_02325 [Clostridia bacterium]|nr:hypothetical protein [Clostridia bacterium]